jgi:hypothetical protein
MDIKTITFHRPVAGPLRSRYRERLSFVLPDFARYSWVNEAARRTWEPRLSRISQAWSEIEWRSVSDGARECSLLWVAPTLLPSLIRQWEMLHLSAIQLASDRCNFGHDHRANSTYGLVCILVGALERVKQLRDAWNSSDDEAVGALMGYPRCCRAFFRDVWIDEHCIDTTWGMAERTAKVKFDGSVDIELPEEVMPFANMLWRRLGVRAVPHLPCRFDCVPSIEFGRRLLEIGKSHGYVDEMEWIAEILSWPVEWSGLHGIAEIKSPILKMSTRTDATAGKRTVRYIGTKYPEEGVSGLGFPYKEPHKPFLTRSSSYRRGLDHQVGIATDANWLYEDNGFASANAMELLHHPLVHIAREVLSIEQGRVLDLGCGNGMLLHKVCEGRDGLVPFGVDKNGVALLHARTLLPDFSSNFIQGDFFETQIWKENDSREFALVFLMLGRLLEIPKEKALDLLSELRSSCRHVLLYVYPDWGSSLESVVKQLAVDVEITKYTSIGFLV